MQNYRLGPVSSFGVADDGSAQEIVTFMAPFPRSSFLFHSELDHSRWVFQTIVCANHLSIVMRQDLIEEIEATLGPGQSLEEAITAKRDNFLADVCKSLALAQVTKDGEARGVVEGYNYYEWLLGVLHGDAQLSSYFVLPRSVYEKIVP